MKLKPDWRKMKEKLTSIYNHLKDKLGTLLDIFYAHYFLMNLVFVGFIFALIILDFEGIRAVKDIDGFSKKQWDFVFYTFFLWTFLLLVQVIKLLLFEAKTKQYKQELNNEWYRKFLEYEYRKNDQNLLSGLPYIMTFFISISAIYVSIIWMQVSVDIVSSSNTWSWQVVLEGAGEMFHSFWAWSGTIFAVFLAYFFGYKLNQLSKKDVLERLYYGEYRK